MKTDSLENYLKLFVTVTLIIILVLSSVVTYILLNEWFLTTSILLILIITLGSFAQRFYNRIKQSFEAISLQISVIENDDFSCSVKPAFKSGLYRKLFDELDRFKESLRYKQRCYDERTILLLNLIGKFDNPVILIDQRGRLTYANRAFSNLIRQDWSLLRLTPIQDLGFNLEKQKWVINPLHEYFVTRHTDYKVFSSQYLDHKGTSSLLVLTNITDEIHHSRKEMWKNSIRVFSHEMNNSITPIKSLAETLRLSNKNEKEKKILDVIIDRCSSLATFISKYNFLFKRHNLELETKPIAHLLEESMSLYPDYEFEVSIACDYITADIPLLKQVLINVLKNATESIACGIQNGVESCTNEVSISFRVENDLQILTIKDCGQGIENPENVFVPYYSTKPNGEGVGLIFCRHVADLHRGSFNVKNRYREVGATAELTLPLNVNFSSETGLTASRNLKNI